MLLRRITIHVKDQNWTAVALDFVIVVVGVFIGIQVANWNDARAERSQEREIVLQLIAEAHETNVRIDDNDVLNAERLSAAIRAHDALKADRLNEVEAAQLQDDLMTLGPWEGVDFVTAGLNRLVDADRLSLISDPELQLSLSRHRENVNVAILVHQNLGQMNLDHIVVLNDRLDFSLKDGERIIVSATEDILVDKVLERRVGQFIFTYQYFDAFRDDSRQKNQEYLADLTRYAEENGWL